MQYCAETHLVHSLRIVDSVVGIGDGERIDTVDPLGIVSYSSSNAEAENAVIVATRKKVEMLIQALNNLFERLPGKSVRQINSAPVPMPKAAAENP